MASSEGIWEGAVGFKYHDAMYSFQFTNLRSNYKEFKHILTNIKEEIAKNISSQAKQRTTPYNLLQWMTFSYLYEINQANQYFSFTGSPIGECDIHISIIFVSRVTFFYFFAVCFHRCVQ